MALENFSLLNSQLEAFMNQHPGFIYLILIVLIWKLIWYGLALYKAIEKKQKTWFVVLFVCAILLNDIGILAILYLYINNKKIRAKQRKR